MRVGINPLRKDKAAEYKSIVLACVVHLPNFEGYHAGRFEVLQTCLDSMVRNCGLDHTLAIWDNGSAPAVEEWIRDAMRPDIYVKSINLGKTAGRTSLMRILPPNRVVSYSDDDMYFYPNWLQPQISLLKTFPKVACVTGYPVRTSFRWGNQNTLRLLGELPEAKLETGRFLPDQWEADFAVSIGRDIEAHRQGTLNDNDIRVTYKNQQAYATSHHCQMIGYSETLARVLTFDGFCMGDERPFDVALDSIGLRLATTERLTRHIGNVLHDELRQDIAAAERVLA